MSAAGPSLSDTLSEPADRTALALVFVGEIIAVWRDDARAQQETPAEPGNRWFDSDVEFSGVSWEEIVYDAQSAHAIERQPLASLDREARS